MQVELMTKKFALFQNVKCILFIISKQKVKSINTEKLNVTSGDSFMLNLH
jgi:hypothetical protein